MQLKCPDIPGFLVSSKAFLLVLGKEQQVVCFTWRPLGECFQQVLADPKHKNLIGSF